jgi:hypothetical protein
MSSVKPRPRWWFLITPKWLAWHAFAVFAAWGMLWLGDWQFHRAVGGNALSWAYTFEWPIFTIFGVIFWGKTIADEWKTPGGKAHQALALVQPGLAGLADADLTLPAGAHTPVITDDFDGEDDPELAAYNAYLMRLSTPASRPQGSTQPGPATG